jgi:cysteine-rich repeat protein
MPTRRIALWFARCAVLVACSAAPARAQKCESESQCSVKKPNILLVLDYSSSMSGFGGVPAYFPPGQTVTTRWGAALDAAQWILRHDQGLFARTARLGLARFAGDPEPTKPGTTIATDRSFPQITDGFAIDVPFDGSDGRYLECKGTGVEAALEVLRSAPPPMGGGTSLDARSIMLTWTRGALRSARELIARTRESHQGEAGEAQRAYEVVLMTDGDWSCPDRFGQGCDENPAPEAARLRADGIPVHVIAFGDATRQPSLNEVALQGGTAVAVDANSPQGIVDALGTVLARIGDGRIVPACAPKLPRVLVTMDASTSMRVGTAPGESKWDKARFALAGNPAAPRPGDPGYVEPVVARRIQIGGRDVAIEDVVHFGMVAFAAADQQMLMASFGPCMRDNIAWAMDPATSCEPPGCRDPYGGGPLSWTFKNSDTDRTPAFVRTTRSYMPACNASPGSSDCLGQVATTFTGQGLTFSRQMIADYKRAARPFKVGAGTRFVNILITDGQTSPGSSDVQAALRALTTDGVDTFVIGFGARDELDVAQLDQYAAWGNTGRALLVDPGKGGAAELADALAGVVTSLELEGCCVLNDCAAEPEPRDPRAVCGDGVIEGEETCDDGAENATYGHCGGLCDGLHLHCGDGRTDAPEQCDDENVVAGDGCDPRCQWETQGDAGASDGGPDAGGASGPGSVRTIAPGAFDAGTRRGSNVPPRRGADDQAVDGMDDDEADGGRARRSSGCAIGGADRPHAALWLVGLLGAWRARRRLRAARARRVGA